MKYEILFEKGDYALILRGETMKEIAVVNGLNKEKGEWDYTCTYWAYEYKGSPIGCCDKTIALSLALDYFRAMTEETYITRLRLEEIATQLKDGLIENNKESAVQYFNEICEMSNKEKEWFGINEESESE